MIDFDSAGNVLVSPDLHTSKVLDDIDILIVNTNFRSNHMSKIEKNIEVIQKMIFEDKKDIDFISEWLRIPTKKFISCINKFNKWNKNKKKNVEEKIKKKIERIQDIKGLIQIYLRINSGKWINIKRILDFISPWILLIPTLSLIHTMRFIRY